MNNIVSLFDLLPAPRQLAPTHYQIIAAALRVHPVAGMTPGEKASIEALLASGRFPEAGFSRADFFAAIRSEVGSDACQALVHLCIQLSRSKTSGPLLPTPGTVSTGGPCATAANTSIGKRTDMPADTEPDLNIKRRRQEAPNPPAASSTETAIVSALPLPNDLPGYTLSNFMALFLQATRNIVELQRQFASLNKTFAQCLKQLPFTTRLTALQREIYGRLLAHPLNAFCKPSGFTDIVVLPHGAGKSLLQALLAVEIAARGGIVLFVSANSPALHMSDYYLCRIQEKLAELVQLGFIKSAPRVVDARFTTKPSREPQTDTLYWTNCWIVAHKLASALGKDSAGVQRQPTALLFDDIHDCTKLPKRSLLYIASLSRRPVSICFAAADSCVVAAEYPFSRELRIDRQLQTPQLLVCATAVPSTAALQQAVAQVLTRNTGRCVVFLPPTPDPEQPSVAGPREVPIASEWLNRIQHWFPNRPMGCGGEEALAKFEQHFSHSNSAVFFLELVSQPMTHSLLPGLNFYAETVIIPSTRGVSYPLVRKYLDRFRHLGGSVRMMKIMLMAPNNNAMLSQLFSWEEKPITVTFKTTA